MRKPTVTKYDKHNINEFDKKIKHMNGVVLFHHPQCMHCIMLKPKWEIMKKQLNVDGDIMEVSAETLEESNSPIKDKVRGFPMIVRVENGKITDHFKEERNIDNMLTFIRHHLNKRNNLDYNYKINKNNNLKKIKRKVFKKNKTNNKKDKNKRKTKKIKQM